MAKVQIELNMYIIIVHIDCCNAMYSFDPTPKLIFYFMN